MSRDYGRHDLQPHPLTEPGTLQDLVERLTVDVTRLDGRLVLRYRLHADLELLRLPDPRPPVRTDGLWKHTCFEAFIGQIGAGEYWEYNFSPSGAWASYHFTGYRQAMAPLLRGAPPRIQTHGGDESLELEATLDLSWLARPAADAGLKLGLSAVIEDRAQGLSYWALKHPDGKPDFHHADGFQIILD